MKLLIFLTIFSLALASDRYQEHPEQQIHSHLLHKDYNNLPFKESWDTNESLFKIKSLNVTEYDEAWKGAHRTFEGGNFHTLAIKAGASATLAEFAHEVIAITKLIVNYHCNNAKGTKPAPIQLIVYDHDHRIYKQDSLVADILRVDFLETTDVRFKFSNLSVRLSNLSFQLIRYQSEPINCFVTAECIECGKFHHRMMNREEFRGKLDRLGQISRYIGVTYNSINLTSNRRYLNL